MRQIPSRDGLLVEKVLEDCIRTSSWRHAGVKEGIYPRSASNIHGRGRSARQCRVTIVRIQIETLLVRDIFP
jgi:hypothetical protein